MKSSITQLTSALLLVVSICTTVVRPQDSRGDSSLQKARLEQNSISCMLKDNKTMRSNFFDSVKAKHGITRKAVRTTVANQNGSPSQKCYSQLDCPNTDVVYCFTLYHPTRAIEVCWDSQNNIINRTDYAAFLGVDGFFEIGHSCTGYSPGPCMVIHKVPFYFDSGLLICTSQNDTCSAKSILTFNIQSADFGGLYELFYHNTTSEMVIGQQNIYYFTAEFHLSIGYGGSVAFFVNNTPVLAIPEYPFCDQVGCPDDQRAGDQFNRLKKNRVRVYSYPSIQKNCPLDKIIYLTWLVIDAAQESDAQNYIIKVYSKEGHFPFQRNVVKKEMQLNLAAVAPVITFEVPSMSAINDSTQLTLGESVQWTVSAQGGVDDQLVWTLDGEELPLVDTPISIQKEALCRISNGSYYKHEVQNVSHSAKNYTATLSLCNLSPAYNGHYECSMNRSRGDERQVTIWSAQIQLSSHTFTEEPVATTVALESPIKPVIVTYIAVGVFISSLLITVVVTLVLVVVCIRVTRRSKRFNRRSSRRSDLVIQSFSNPAGITGAWNSTHYNENSRPVDEFEFPRERLVIMDKVLGKGTFGLVLLAKAEGIAKDMPNRNMVAVKTHKVSAPDQEVDNLWEELQIMKKIKPHPHIVNLLGYCRETSNNPLYLIVEFAMYGSLQNFLKECEEAVLCMNHSPHVSYKTGRYQSCSDSPTFMSQSLKFSHESSSSKKTTLSHPSNPAAASAATKTCEQGDMLTCESDATVVGSSAQAVYDCISAPATHDYINSKGLLYVEDVQSFALQIASGLKHLEKEKIVHCDLAARNILISEGLMLKIGDFGMARDMSEKEYYRKSEGHIPVKWTAPEALETHVFTHKSDIWSFGVTLWEIFSYGKRPYSDMKIGQSWEPFVQSLKGGKRLPQPNGCPDIFYGLMQQCWSLNPDERPSTSDIIASISAFSDTDYTSGSYHSGNSMTVTEELPVKSVRAQPFSKSSDNEDAVSIRLEESETSQVCEENGYCNTTLGALEPEGYQSLANAEIITVSPHVTQV